MFTACQYQMLIADKVKSIIGRLWLIFTASGKVTFLLFIFAIPGAVRAYDANGIDLRSIEFESESFMLRRRGCLYGRMATDCSRHRISIYWAEPALFRDSTFFLGYSDFIFEEDVVHYWIHGASKPVTFNLSEKKSEFLLTRDVSAGSVVSSALAIVNRIRSQPNHTVNSLEVGKFFRQSRDQADYSYEVPSDQTISDRVFVNTATDEQILNALPYGRKYSKETRSDGALVWCAQRALDSRSVFNVTIKPVSSAQMDGTESTFNPDSLGKWILVPEPYRAYWLLDRTYSELKDTTDDGVPSRELYDRIESYIDKNEVPERIDIAFNQLLFKTALLTGDKQRVSRSAHAIVAVLCRDSSVNDYQNLLELARIDAQIRRQYSEQADEIVCPLAGLMISHIGPDVKQSLERLMTSIENNRWFSYGKLLVDEVRIQDIEEEDFTDSLAARLEASRLARTRPPADPCEASASVKQYLAHLDADPPKGNLTWMMFVKF